MSGVGAVGGAVKLGYACFYAGKKISVEAESQYEAVLKARAALKVPKSKWGLLAVVLAEKDGEPVEISTSSI